MFSETGAGSDRRGLSMRAFGTAKRWILNGQKVWTKLATWLVFGIIIVRTDTESRSTRG